MAPKASVAAAPAAGTLKLPVLVFGIVEVRRLKRELEALEEYMRQAAIRESGKQAALPRVSRLLDALATDNHLNLLQPEHRQQLQAFLKDIERRAPRLHISFATDPSSAFTAKMVTWLRSSIDPNALLEIGLQPTITAGAVVRTTNKIFDMSLRDRFANATAQMLEAFEKEATNVAAPQAATAPAGGAPGGGTPAPQEPGAATSGKPAQQGAGEAAAGGPPIVQPPMFTKPAPATPLPPATSGDTHEKLQALVNSIIQEPAAPKSAASTEAAK